MLMSLTSSFLSVFLGFSVLWVVYRKTDRLAVIDLFWGPGFVVIAGVHAAIHGLTLPQTCFLVALSLWALRLTWYLGGRLRTHTKDDPRYETMKKDGGPTFRLSSLWKVFWLQAVIQFALALPIHSLYLLEAQLSMSPYLFGFGVFLFTFGFAIETLADAQMSQFKARQTGPRQLMTSGLWAWSRHPNHFGESVLWFGLAFMVVGVTDAWWVLASPVILTAIMVKLSGVAMLDAHLSQAKDGFDAYAARTSAFIPLPPKRS